MKTGRLVSSLLIVISLFLFLGMANEVLAEQKPFPSKTITLVSGFGAGGSTSIGGRIIAGTLQEILGTPVVLVHKTGAGGTLAPIFVLKSNPDGYTLLIANTGPMTIAPFVRKIQYRPLEDFEFLGQYAVEPMGLVVKTDAPWKTLKELVADIKKEPGKIKFAMDGINTPSNFGMELFKGAAGGLKADAIPFNSSAEMIAAVLGGHAQMAYSYMMSAKGPYEGGKLRILAVGTEERLKDLPNIPTFAEMGYPEVKWGPFFGLATPAAVPGEVKDKLKDALRKTAQNSEVQKLLDKVGIIPVYKDAEEFTKSVRDIQEKVQRLVKELGIKVE
jgi:tripartite-type tricarboxylate transporter receptor subunit TctC